MAGALQYPNLAAANGIAVIGIDVGGQRKGFHAVALTGGEYSGRYATSNVGYFIVLIMCLLKTLNCDF